MLVFSRRVGDAVVCTTAAGEEIEIKVLRIGSGGKIRLGVEAPRDCRIERRDMEVVWTLAEAGQLEDAEAVLQG